MIFSETSLIKMIDCNITVSLIKQRKKRNLPNVASVVGSLNLRRTQYLAALSVSSDKSGCNAGYSNTVEQNFFEEPGGIVAHRRHQIGCHVFPFPQACLLFPLLSYRKDDRKVRFSKLN